jgi:hypothetical protein
MLATYVLMRPSRWLWLPNLALVRSWMYVGSVLLCFHNEPYWVRFWFLLAYGARAYVRAVHRTRELMGVGC